MRIRMITTASGPDWSATQGDVVDVDNKFAKQLIDGRYAEAVDLPVTIAKTPAIAKQPIAKKNKYAANKLSNRNKT